MAAVVSDSNQIRIEYQSSKTPHAELFSSFEYGEQLLIRLHVSENFEDDAFRMEVYDDQTGQTFFLPSEKRDGFFAFSVDLKELCQGNEKGLFYYSFVSKKFRISQNEYGDGYILGNPNEEYSKFQLSVYKKGSNRPSKYRGGVMYQIFPDRFYKGKGAPLKEGALWNPDWENGIPEYGEKRGDQIPNRTFFGGTLYGITEKLEYLASLGVTILYLNPIFEAASNHKYDTGDYLKVDSMFGGDEALLELISKAKEKGISIVLDGVFNHTGEDSIYFNKYGHYRGKGAYQSKDSPYYSWYFFKNYPTEYESWWGVQSLPKVNSRNPDYISFITGEHGVMEKYMKMGIAGWRLDVVDELSNEFLTAFREKQKKENDRSLIYGEVWEDASNKIAYGKRRQYFMDGQLDAVTNYPLKNAIIAFLTEGDADFLYFTEKILYAHYPKAVSDMQMNVLSTHDTARILTVLGGEPDGLSSNAVQSKAKLTKEEREIALSRLRLAYLLIATFPGIPTIYYGDEVGMEGYSDPFCRCPFPWGKEDKALLGDVRRIMKLRKEYTVLTDGFYQGLLHHHGVFAFERFSDTDSLKVFVNMSDADYEIRLDEPGFSVLENRVVKGRVVLPKERAFVLYSETKNREEV